VYRALRFVVIVGATWATVEALPDIARYLKIRAM
jgi:hypothetical protein